MSRIDQFLAYINKTFKINSLFECLEDGRINPDVPMSKIAMAVFLGSAFRIRSVSELERQCSQGMLKGRIGPISDDTFGYGLDHVDSLGFWDIWMSLNKLIKRNGILRKNAFNGKIVSVLDGIETLSSYSRCCDRCLSREITHNDQVHIQYYHRSVVLSLSGFDHPIPLALEMMRPKEGEVDCGLRLLQRLTKRLGPRFLDIVIGDALYCTPAFFHGCKELGIQPGAVLKDNQPSLLQESRTLKKIIKPVYSNHTRKSDIRLWDIKNVHWETGDCMVRVIWADRKDRVTTEVGKKRKIKEEVKINAFAFSTDLDSIPTRFLYRIGKRRQDIDSHLFQDMTQNCFLKHPTLHFNNAYENLLIIRMLAYLLMQFFFHRHINSRRIYRIESISHLVKEIVNSLIISQAPS